MSGGFTAYGLRALQAAAQTVTATPASAPGGVWKVTWGSRKTGEFYGRAFNDADAKDKAKRHADEMSAQGYAVEVIDPKGEVYTRRGSLPGSENQHGAFIIVTAGSGLRRTSTKWSAGRNVKVTPVWQSKASAEAERRKLPSPELWRVDPIDTSTLPADAPADWQF